MAGERLEFQIQEITETVSSSVRRFFTNASTTAFGRVRLSQAVAKVLSECCQCGTLNVFLN